MRSHIDHCQMEENTAATETEKKFYYSIGFSHFDGLCLTAGITTIKSNKSTLTATEARDLAYIKIGRYPGVITSFTPISREQFMTFREEEKKGCKKDLGNTDELTGGSADLIYRPCNLL